MTHVFVYGTLKKGQPNHYRLFDKANGEAEFLASASTSEKFPLVIAGEYNIPFLLNLPGQGQQVQGEIYRVDQQMLRYLDELESVPSMYQRTVVKLQVKECEGEEQLSPGSSTEAFVYSTTTYQPLWPSLPTCDSYDSQGPHGLEYVPRHKRV
ncbi:gamma-glutamylaminecyclotransferase-like [Genypterus blacodes]|uniref:gamma-glutamylaminecyclotransferase-like n=1 Tax=Genypterus blacodes TaxID=154954 RepID=UPI003F763491